MCIYDIINLGKILDDEIFTLVYFGHFTRLDVLTMTYRERERMFQKIKEVNSSDSSEGIPLHTLMETGEKM
ncbi:hypothetical protein EOM09_02100 [bacterium]|nr:hypothetical protein [bacterium]